LITWPICGNPSASNLVEIKSPVFGWILPKYDAFVEELSVFEPISTYTCLKTK
jgi:hypothetical protein